jgi:tellurite resistance protein
MSCSEFIQNVIQSSPDGRLSPETKQRIAERLRECKSLSTVAGLSTYQAAKKVLLTAGAIGAGVFLISATAFAATCDDSGSGGGCGGGSSDAIPKDCIVINGIVVPPEPDAKANTATIAGVDSNNNGVRDDVERKAAEVSNNKVPFDINMQIAKQYAIIMKRNSTKDEVIAAFNKIRCIAENYPTNNSGDVAKLIANTKDRDEAYLYGYTVAIENGLSVSEVFCE